MKIISIFLICFASSQVFSQSQIKGKITDTLSSKPLEYAIVSIFNTSDDKLVNGKLTDSTGTFVFDKIDEGNYYLKIDLIGYRTSYVRGILIDKSKMVNLGNINMNVSSAMLNEVEVNAVKDPNQVKIDKQTYKADQFESAKGGTAIDVLKNLPSFTINAEGDIRLRGSGGILVLINGKPVNADIQTVLNQIPANSIENIELITAPTAKYDADGKSGIINITTKKGTTDGLTFMVNGQYGLPSVDMYNNKEQPKRYGTDITLNYIKNKWDFTFGAGYLQNDIQGLRDGDVNTTFNSRYTTFPSIGERSFDRKTYSVRASITYNVNKNNSFNFAVYHGQRQQFRLADIDYTTTRYINGLPVSNYQYFNNNLVKKQGEFSLVNLDYTYTFANKSTLNLSGLYEYAFLDGFTKNKDFALGTNTNPINDILNTGTSPIHGLRAKTDYTINIGKGKLESGYQIRYQTQTGSYVYKDVILNYTTVNQTVDAYSADIRIENLIHGLYSQYSGKLKKLEYTIGMRYEHAQRLFTSSKGDNFPLTLNNLFPSANLLYGLKENVKLKGGFSRRVQRSTNNELNPYPEREHAETLERGDPDIKPEFVNLSELGLIYEYKKGSVFFTFYNQYIENVVNRVNNVYNDTILNRIYTNAGNAAIWGIEAGFNYNPIKWWKIYIGGNIYNYNIRGSLFDNAVTVKNSGLAYSFNTNQNFQLLNTLSLQLNMNYLSLRPTAIGEDSRFLSPNISVKKTFLGGKLSAMLQWQNIGLGILPSNEQRITTRGANFYTTTNYIQEKDVLWIHLSYNFKQSNKKVKLPGSEFGEKEF
ncbi:MAG: TonB-dependent receptor [Cytophagales bacterium]|nr:TonB-dependent receptor [Cytophagales bacterium]